MNDIEVIKEIIRALVEDYKQEIVTVDGTPLIKISVGKYYERTFKMTDKM